MSRADRWWRPTNRRPAVRARSRVYRYNEYDVNLAYDRGIMRGTRDTARRHEIRDMVERAYLKDPDRMNQIAEACELDGEAGKEALEALAREWGVFPEGDDLLDVADEAGVTPLADVDPDQLVDALEAWLREQE